MKKDGRDAVAVVAVAVVVVAAAVVVVAVAVDAAVAVGKNFVADGRDADDERSLSAEFQHFKKFLNSFFFCSPRQISSQRFLSHG